MVGAQYPADKLPNGADMTDVVAFFDAVAKLARGSLTFIEHHRLVLRAGGVVWTSSRSVVNEFDAKYRSEFRCNAGGGATRGASAPAALQPMIARAMAGTEPRRRT